MRRNFGLFSFCFWDVSFQNEGWVCKNMVVPCSGLVDEGAGIGIVFLTFYKIKALSSSFCSTRTKRSYSCSFWLPKP